MASLNKVMIIGNLGADPEKTTTPSGLVIAKFSLATSETRTNKDTGEKNELTEWHRVTTFGPQAESCVQYLAKGRQVYVEGRLKTSSYEKDGITRYSTDIIATVVTFLGSANTNQHGGYGHNNAPHYQNQPPQNQPAYYQNQPAQNQPAQGGYGQPGGYPSQNDIPF